MLRAWSSDSSFKDCPTVGYFAPEGVQSFVAKLAKVSGHLYAVTGSLAAAAFVEYAPAHQIQIYADHGEALAGALELRPPVDQAPTSSSPLPPDRLRSSSAPSSATTSVWSPPRAGLRGSSRRHRSPSAGGGAPPRLDDRERDRVENGPRRTDDYLTDRTPGAKTTRVCATRPRHAARDGAHKRARVAGCTSCGFTERIGTGLTEVAIRS